MKRLGRTTGRTGGGRRKGAQHLRAALHAVPCQVALQQSGRVPGSSNEAGCSSGLLPGTLVQVCQPAKARAFLR